MFGKPLAYIVKIKEIREIPGADRIELASVMDYTVVVKKNEYKPDDLALYVEVDSVLPDGISPDLVAKLEGIKNGTILADASEEVRQNAIDEILKTLFNLPMFNWSSHGACNNKIKIIVFTAQRFLNFILIFLPLNKHFGN